MRPAASGVPRSDRQRPAYFSITLQAMSTIEAVQEVGSAIDWLERMAGDWRLLDTLPAAERQRLHRAIAALSTADPRANRKRRKAARAESVQREEAVLNETGIRARRRRPVVTTPNVFPPPARARPRRRRRRRRTSSVDRVCYVCKAAVLADPPLLRPALPRLRRRQLRRAHRARGSARAGRAADRRAREDRLSGRLEAAALGRAPDRDDPVSAAMPRRATRRNRTSASGAIGSRSSGSICGTLPSVEAFCRDMVATRDRLDFIINNACQTVRRPPEFYAHMMAGELTAAHELPAACPPAARRAAAPDRPARGDETDRSPRSCRKCRLLDEELAVADQPLPRRSTRRGSAAGRSPRHGTRGACCSPTCRRSRCSKCSW